MTVLLGGSRPCKDPKNVKDDDFFFHGFGSVDTIPGLNTLGIRVTPLTLGPGDLNPPHYHPRAAELVYVVKGSVEAGFVTSGPEFRLFKKILKEGDVFVVPFGLVHFQTNIGKDNSTAELLVFFNSDKPGVVTMSSVLFGSVPLLPVDLLAKSLQVDESVIKEFQNAAN